MATQYPYPWPVGGALPSQERLEEVSEQEAEEESSCSIPAAQRSPRRCNTPGGRRRGSNSSREAPTAAGGRDEPTAVPGRSASPVALLPAATAVASASQELSASLEVDAAEQQQQPPLPGRGGGRRKRRADTPPALPQQAPPRSLPLKPGCHEDQQSEGSKASAPPHAAEIEARGLPVASAFSAGVAGGASHCSSSSSLEQPVLTRRSGACLAILCGALWVSCVCCAAGSVIWMHIEVASLRQDLRAVADARHRTELQQALGTTLREELQEDRRQRAVPSTPLERLLSEHGLEVGEDDVASQKAGEEAAQEVPVVADIHLTMIAAAEAKRRSDPKYRGSVNPMAEGLRLVAAQGAAVKTMEDQVARLQSAVSSMEKKLEQVEPNHRPSEAGGSVDEEQAPRSVGAEEELLAPEDEDSPSRQHPAAPASPAGACRGDAESRSWCPTPPSAAARAEAAERLGWAAASPSPSWSPDADRRRSQLLDMFARAMDTVPPEAAQSAWKAAVAHVAAAEMQASTARGGAAVAEDEAAGASGRGPGVGNAVAS